MSDTPDEAFYARADAHILLSNQQLSTVKSVGQASASMMYGTARFNAWISAMRCKSGEEMALSQEATLNYFCEQYRAMLKENLEDYSENFSAYMTPPKA